MSATTYLGRRVVCGVRACHAVLHRASTGGEWMMAVVGKCYRNSKGENSHLHTRRASHCVQVLYVSGRGGLAIIGVTAAFNKVYRWIQLLLATWCLLYVI